MYVSIDLQQTHPIDLPSFEIAFLFLHVCLFAYWIFLSSHICRTLLLLSVSVLICMFNLNYVL